MKIYLIKKYKLEVKNTNLLSSIFDTDKMEIKRINNWYVVILLSVIVISTCLILVIKKDNFYENYIVSEGGEVIIIVEKSKINMIKDKSDIIINDIKNNYNIIKINQDGDNYLVYISLKISMDNINHQKYQILLGKETIIEYIIKIILG